MPFDNPNAFPLPISAPASLPMTGRERLRVLADFLDAVPPERFSIKSFWCGTAGCALGWAVHIPEFAAAGWIMRNGFPGLTGNTDVYKDAGKFFGSPSAAMYRLFNGCQPGDITAKQVATNIRTYLAERVS